jgi:Transglycosylase-like domain
MFGLKNKKRGLLVLMSALMTFVTVSLDSLLPSKLGTESAFAAVTRVTMTTLVSASDMVAWSKVAWCETHGKWNAEGWKYEGGLGITPYNWAKFGGMRFAPVAWLATPQQQVWVAKRIQGKYAVPDQDGGACVNW